MRLHCRLVRNRRGADHQQGLPAGHWLGMGRSGADTDPFGCHRGGISMVNYVHISDLMAGLHQRIGYGMCSGAGGVK